MATKGSRRLGQKMTNFSVSRQNRVANRQSLPGKWDNREHPRRIDPSLTLRAAGRAMMRSGEILTAMRADSFFVTRLADDD